MPICPPDLYVVAFLPYCLCNGALLCYVSHCPVYRRKGGYMLVKAYMRVLFGACPDSVLRNAKGAERNIVSKGICPIALYPMVRKRRCSYAQA